MRRPSPYMAYAVIYVALFPTIYTASPFPKPSLLRVHNITRGLVR